VSNWIEVKEYIPGVGQPDPVFFPGWGHFAADQRVSYYLDGSNLYIRGTAKQTNLYAQALAEAFRIPGLLPHPTIDAAAAAYQYGWDAGVVTIGSDHIVRFNWTKKLAPLPAFYCTSIFRIY